MVQITVQELLWGTKYGIHNKANMAYAKRLAKGKVNRHLEHRLGHCQMIGAFRRVRPARDHLDTQRESLESVRRKRMIPA